MAFEDAPLAQRLPATLVRYLKEGRCILFVGSGLSAWGNLPTWTKLLEIMIEKLQDEGLGILHIEELKELLKAGKYLEVADYCKEKFGDRLHAEILSEQLRGDKVDIPEPHKVIMSLPFAGIVTTNYDKLLERAYFRQTNNWPKVQTHMDIAGLGSLLFDGNDFILKAHGDIDRPESLILTTPDYREIIHSNPAFNAIFSAILLTRAILFVGYSINDPDFRLLLDRQLTTFKGSVPGRYALMSKVGEVEREVLSRTARIQIISYNTYDEVLTFLQALYDAIIRDPMSEL